MTKTTRALSGLVALGTLLAATTASVAKAGELKVPQAKPEIVMDIPDGWAVEHSKSGFEIRSPEKNSIIVGRTMMRDKKVLETWSKEAAGKLEAFGIKFDPNAKAPPPKEATKADGSSGTAAKSGDKPAERASAFTTDPGKFTFSGVPSLKMPGTSGSNNAIKTPENSIEGLTGFGDPTGANNAKLPFRAVQYYGTTLADKPVDVQLVVYNLPSNRVFVMMQESGSDDGRAVAMAQSVRSAK